MGESGADLVVAVLAVAAALWINALDSSVEQMDKFGTPKARVFAGIAFILGMIMIGVVLLAGAWATLKTGFLGGALTVLLVGAIIWALPYSYRLQSDIAEALDELWNDEDDTGELEGADDG